MTYDTVYNSMLPKQDDLSWGTDEPFLLISFIKLQFLNSKGEGVIVRKSDVFVFCSVYSNSAGID
jgi:hypothetical protein